LVAGDVVVVELGDVVLVVVDDEEGELVEEVPWEEVGDELHAAAAKATAVSPRPILVRKRLLRLAVLRMASS
jgi:hypothetical protein